MFVDVGRSDVKGTRVVSRFWRAVTYIKGSLMHGPVSISRGRLEGIFDVTRYLSSIFALCVTAEESLMSPLTHALEGVLEKKYTSLI